MRIMASILVPAVAVAAHVVAPSQTPSPTPSSAVFRLPATDPRLERNKDNVLAFYDLMFNRASPAEAMRRYGGATYTQHNPEVPDGKAAFLAFFEKIAKDYPGKSVRFRGNGMF